MMHQLSASLFVFRLNRILDRRTRGAPFIAAGGEETEGCSSGIRADNLVFPGINWCSRLVNGRKGEKRVVETERRVPARNWSGSRGSSSDFTGPSLSLSLSLERREEESSGGFEVEESRVSKPGKWMFGVGREARHASFARTAIDSRRLPARERKRTNRERDVGGKYG